MKTALVTGANSGMGLETTKLLSSSGIQVFAGVRSEEGVSTINELSDSLSIPPIPVIMDVTNNESIEKAIRWIENNNANNLDFLINNAGYGLVSSVEEATDEMFIRQFDVNVFGVFRTCRAIIPIMRKQGSGHIINVSSFLGKMGLPYLAHYNASKYAVEGITDSLRYELAEFGIKVTTVAPGLFKTSFANKGLELNCATIDEKSPYSISANNFIPNVADKINNGSDPIEVAKAILSITTDQTQDKRISVGSDSLLFDETSKDLDEQSFEVWLANTMGINCPV